MFAVLGWFVLSIVRLLGVEVGTNVIEPLLGILAVNGIYSRIESHISVRPYMKKTFWVYCFHNAVTNYCLSIGFLIGGKNTITMALLPLITLIVGVGLSLVIGDVCERCWPRGYSILSGGR